MLHAVFLSNHYMTKQYALMLYKSKAACQALITIALAARLNRAKKEICAKSICTPQGYVHVLYIMGTCLPFRNLSNFPEK